MREPPLLRRTTTPLRGAGSVSWRGPAVAAAVVVSIFALAAWQGFSSSGDAGAAPAGCAATDCGASSAGVRSVSAALEPAPCPYCDQDPERWRAYTTKAPPEIGGESAAVIEASCGALLYGRDENARRPPASLTKIVAALVVMESAKPSDIVDIRINGWDLAADDGSSIMGIEAGMRLTVEDLVHGMLLVSGNDAALALAGHFGGAARFVEMMNARVKRLGLTNTHFANPDGRDNPAHYSSALDMALLGRALLQDPALRGIVNTKSYLPHWNGRVLWNNNEMIYAYNDAVGVKIGYTEGAEFTIVTGIERDGRLLIASVFGSWNLYTDPVRLLNWAFANTRSACGG